MLRFLRCYSLHFTRHSELLRGSLSVRVQALNSITYGYLTNMPLTPNSRRMVTVVTWALTVLLGSCTSFDASRYPQLLELNSPERWSIDGKASVVGADGVQSFSYNWSYQPDDEALELYTSANLRLLRYSRQGQSSRLDIVDQPSIYDAQPEQALRQHLQLDLPLEQLRYWLVGRPDPQVRIAALSFDDSQRLRFLRQAGWELSYSSYHIGGLPKLIKLSKGSLDIKIFVRAWSLPDSTPSASHERTQVTAI